LKVEYRKTNNKSGIVCFSVFYFLLFILLFLLLSDKRRLNQVYKTEEFYMLQN